MPPQGGFGGGPHQPPPPGQGAAPLIAGTNPNNPNAGVPQQGAVMMVYGMDYSKMSAERLFNLFCLYGNVVRVSSN